MAEGKYIGLDRPITATEVDAAIAARPFPTHPIIEEMVDRELRLLAKVYPKAFRVRRWWEFWLAPQKPKVYVLDAETGKFFDPGTPQTFWSWAFEKMAGKPLKASDL